MVLPSRSRRGTNRVFSWEWICVVVLSAIRTSVPVAWVSSSLKLILDTNLFEMGNWSSRGLLAITKKSFFSSRTPADTYVCNPL